MANPVKVSHKFQAGGQALQLVAGNTTRVNASAVTAPGSAEAALPAGATDLVIVRATDAVWLRFGTTGMGAAAADANSILFLGGEAPVPIPSGSTHFRVLRVGSADVPVQLEGVATY